GTEGPAPAEALAVMQRDLPAWVEGMNRRGLRRFGRELDFPETAVTVRVRDGQTLVTDGPFAETKEFVAGGDVLECDDLDQALEAMGSSPVARYHPIEVRPFLGGVRLGAGAPAVGRDVPAFLLSVWVDAAPAGRDGAVDAWRQDVDARGLLVLGGELAGP